ncbi:hypothetical protein J6590_018033 [Homalodisca vitripennis]|nr:hypothetical protein J6590_018033 [Homalodisca vitripennis]
MNNKCRRTPTTYERSRDSYVPLSDGAIWNIRWFRAPPLSPDGEELGLKLLDVVVSGSEHVHIVLLLPAAYPLLAASCHPAPRYLLCPRLRPPTHGVIATLPGTCRPITDTTTIICDSFSLLPPRHFFLPRFVRTQFTCRGWGAP